MKRHYGSDSNEEEMALAAFQTSFKGKCNYCGKIGHKAVDCREKKRDNVNDNIKDNKNQKSFNGECFYCHKKGHMARDCRKKKADEERNNDRAMMTMEEADIKRDEEADIALVTFEEYMRIEEDELIKQMELDNQIIDARNKEQRKNESKKPHVRESKERRNEDQNMGQNKMGCTPERNELQQMDIEPYKLADDSSIQGMTSELALLVEERPNSVTTINKKNGTFREVYVPLPRTRDLHPRHPMMAITDYECYNVDDEATTTSSDLFDNWETCLMTTEEDDNLLMDMGICENCGSRGLIGSQCTACEDSGMVFVAADDVSNVSNTGWTF